MKQSADKILQDLLDSPEITIKTICRHVSAGGTLPDLCDTWGTRYADVVAWLQNDQAYRAMYTDALNARAEWGKEEVFSELRRMSKANHVDFFNDDGSIKKPSEWSPDMKSMVKEVYMDDDGEIKSLKFWNKEKALELLGKNMEMFKESHVVSGTLTLEDIIQGSREIKDE